MNTKYTAFKSFMFHIIIGCILGIIFNTLLKEYLAGFVLVAIIIFPMIFKDYKVVITDEKIQFYSLFKKRKDYKLDNITKIEINKLDIPIAIFGPIKKIKIYSNESCYSFDIDKIKNEHFYNNIEMHVKYHNIEYVNKNKIFVK